MGGKGEAYQEKPDFYKGKVPILSKMALKKHALTAIGIFSDDFSEMRPLPSGWEDSMESGSGKGLLGKNSEAAEPGFDILFAGERNGIDRRTALVSLRKAALEISARKLRKNVGLDYLLINEINSLDDLNVILNSLVTRLKELWGLYYPEMDAADNKAFARKVSEGAEKPESSIGAKIPKDELEKISSFAKAILGLYSEKEAIEKNIEALAEKLAPATSKACGGGTLAARLIARAGNLGRLAFMPSSTIQVLGAEKALFKHLTRGVPCPKHGIIFQHQSIQGAPKEKRGKFAREIAGKISIAARVDFFSGPMSGLAKE